MFKRIWHDPVGSNFIAGLLLSAFLSSVAVIWAWIHFHWWSVLSKTTASAVHLVWAFLIATSPIPHWLIGLTGLIALLAIAVVGIAAVAASSTQTVPESLSSAVEQTARRYTTDIFYKVRWRWDYLPSGEITTPVCFCPKCDCQLVAHDVSPIGGQDKIAFHCASCNGYVAEIGERLDRVEVLVTLLIQQKLRNLRDGAVS